MKTIVDSTTNCSKYLFADSVVVVVEAECIKVTELRENGSGPTIMDMNAGNATLIEGVTEPEDWFGCKYNYVGGEWVAVEGWVDPRLKEDV